VKSFGQHLALDGLDLSVPRGSVFGFLGPNGAGKTTTLRILAGLARASAGATTVFGHDLPREAGRVRPRMGYLPDVPGFPGWMSARRYLRYAGELFGLEAAVLAQRADALLELAGLEAVEGPIETYSRGMKQRLGVAQALVNAPELLLLDEPTSALDPIGRRDVLTMIAGLRGRTTVLFSTHILADVERVCDTVAILDRGRVLRQAAIEDLHTGQDGRHRLLVEVDQPGRLHEALVSRSWLRSIEARDELLVLGVADLAMARRELPALVAALGLELRRLELEEPSLEDVFIDLVGDPGAAQRAADLP